MQEEILEQTHRVAHFLKWATPLMLTVLLIWYWQSGRLAKFVEEHSPIRELSKQAGVTTANRMNTKQVARSASRSSEPRASSTLASFGKPGLHKEPQPYRPSSDKILDRFPPFFDRVNPNEFPTSDRQYFVISVTDDTKVAEVAVFWKVSNSPMEESLQLDYQGATVWGAPLPKDFNLWKGEVYFRARDVYDHMNQSRRFYPWEVVTFTQQRVAQKPAMAPNAAPEAK